MRLAYSLSADVTVHLKVLCHRNQPCVVMHEQYSKSDGKQYDTKNQDSVFVWTFLHICPGEGDEDDVCVGAVSGPGGAEPQCGLEAPGHLCLQHRASPLGGGGGTWAQTSAHPPTCSLTSERRRRDWICSLHGVAQRMLVDM